MSGKIGFRNNSSAVLLESMGLQDDWLYVGSSLSEKFTPPDGTDYLVATLGDPGGDFEIVHLFEPAQDGVGLCLSVLRAQEDTVNMEWPAGTPIQGLLTAGGLKALAGSAEGGFVADASGNLLAGAAAISKGTGAGGLVIALLPYDADIQGKAFEAGAWVGTGDVVYYGAYEFLILNDGNLGADPISSMSSKSGEVRYATIGRYGERKLNDGSVTLGPNVLPGGYGSVVVGMGAKAAGEASGSAVVVGSSAIAGGSNAVALGADAHGLGESALAIGSGAKALAVRSIALRATVDVQDAWAIGGVPLLSEGNASSNEAYADTAAIAPEGTVGLGLTDIGEIRTWAPGMTVRTGDAVLPTTGGDYLYVAQVRFDPQVQDNSVETGAQEPEFNGYYAFEEKITWGAVNIAAGRKYTFEIPSHVMFFATEIGFLSTSAGAVTAAAQISFGTEGAPAAVLNQVALPGPLGANRMHRLSIENVRGLTGVVQVTLDTPVAGGQYQGRFYLRGLFTRTRG